MQVILIKDLKGVGKQGQIKEVKDGYGKNFLINKGYAIVASPANIEKLKEQNAKKQEIEEKNKQEAIKLKEKLEKVTLTFKVKTGDKDKVFGSVSVKQIKEELAKLEYKIDKQKILINESLSSLGFHKVEVELYKDVYATVKIHLIK